MEAVLALLKPNAVVLAVAVVGWGLVIGRWLWDWWKGKKNHALQEAKEEKDEKIRPVIKEIGDHVRALAAGRAAAAETDADHSPTRQRDVATGEVSREMRALLFTIRLVKHCAWEFLATNDKAEVKFYEETGERVKNVDVSDPKASAVLGFDLLGRALELISERQRRARIVELLLRRILQQTPERFNAVETLRGIVGTHGERQDLELFNWEHLSKKELKLFGEPPGPNVYDSPG